MADINQIISLGIGSPAAIQEFLTFGLQQGPATIVPNVVGETEAQATIDIQAVGLTVSITYAYDGVVLAGLVISQNPVGGSSVVPGSDVAIVVSLGQAPVGGSNPGGGGGGRAEWSPKFEFTPKKKRKKAKTPPVLEESPKSIESDNKPSPVLAKTLAADLLSKLDDDDEAIAAVIEYETQLIASVLSRLK